MNTTHRIYKHKKAMSTFEVIGYAILAIVVILVAVTIFLKLTQGPAKTIGDVGTNSQTSIDACIQDPSKCAPTKTESMPKNQLRQQLSVQVNNNKNYA